MDKIKKKWPNNVELREKVNELVEENNKLKKRIDNHIIKHSQCLGDKNG